MRKGILNRGAVQKCRQKELEYTDRLEKDRTALIHDNEILQRVKIHVELSGVLDLARRVLQAQGAGVDTTTVVLAFYNQPQNYSS